MSENELLLCTYDDTEGTGTFGTMANDPKSSNDTLHPGSIEDLSNILDTGAKPEYWNGYVFKSVGNYLDGTASAHVFKVQNGQEIEVGQLPEAVGNSINLLSPETGLVAGDDGNLYRLIDNGASVTAKLVGPTPSMPGDNTAYGHCIFFKYTDGDQAHSQKVGIVSADDPTGILSVATVASGSAQNSDGITVDEQTGELVIGTQNGYKVGTLPPLDQDGKLPADISVADIQFGPTLPLGKDVARVVASNGYKYFKTSDGKDLIVVTPDNPQTPYTITKAQLGIAQNCVPGGCINTILKLESGGIYVIFNDDMNIAPASLTPTADPAEFMSPTLPFKKTTDELSDITQHIINNGCTVVTGDKSMFQPLPDPCAEDESICDDTNPCTTDTCTNDNGQAVCDNIPSAGQTCDDEAKCTTNDKCDSNGDCAGTPKTCGQPANQCEQSAGCNPNTGDCQTENKTDGTLCNDNDQSTENDQCVSGACQGTPIANPEPNPEPEEDVVEEADVVEQEEDTAEPDEDVVEQDETTSDTNDTSDAYDTVDDTADTSIDTAEDTAPDQSNDNATPEVVNPETTNPEQSVDVFEDALYVEGEDTVSPETATEEISAEIYAETQEVIAAEKDHPKKSPGGCGCNTTGVSPDGMNGTLLLGAMLIGLAANMRYKILNALAKRSR